MKRLFTIALAALLLIPCLTLTSCMTTATNNTVMTDYTYITTIGSTIVGFLKDSSSADADKKLAEDLFKRLGEGAETKIEIREYPLSEAEIKDALSKKEVDLVISVKSDIEEIEGVEKTDAYTVSGTEYVILLRSGSDLTEKINSYIANHKSDIESIYAPAAETTNSDNE